MTFPLPPAHDFGGATLYQGDALRVLTALPDGCVDHVFTDPPFCSGGLFARARTATTNTKYCAADRPRHADFGGDSRDQRSFVRWFALWASECYRLVRTGGLFVTFTDWRQLPVTTDALQAAGFVWRGVVVWDKTESARPDKGRFRHQAEYVVWGSKGPMPKPAADAPCLPGVLRHRVNPAEKHHIAGKPLALMADLLRITQPGDVVLDPFMGSASTGCAALAAGRRFIGIEQLPEIFTIAGERIARAA